MKPTTALRLRRWSRTARQLAALVIVVTAFRSAVADWNDVPSGSMEPTILVGDRVFVNRAAYDLKVPYTTWHLAEWANPQRGDVVVFNSPADGKRLIKRIVGLPGDTVEIRRNVLLINGAPAGYTELPDAVKHELDAPERYGHGFAEELIGSHTHPVMSTPTLPARRDFGPVVVPADGYFMLGDNRDNSADSRYIGFVPRRNILGRATSVVLSVDYDNQYTPRWHRWFSALP